MGEQPRLPALHLATRAVAGDHHTPFVRAAAVARASLAAFLGGDAAAAAESRAWLRDAAARAPMCDASRGAALAEAAWRCGPDSEAAAAALRMLCTSRPADVAAVLAASPGAWTRCFRADAAGAARAASFFGAFSPDGRHTGGASALARYLLQHRDAAWRLVAWRGPHPQAPGVVAAKPALFCEVDVGPTLAALPPSFWACDDVAQALRDGALVALDPAFCLAELRAAWRAGCDAQRRSLRGSLAAALAAQPPRRACHALLPALPSDEELLRALRHWLPRADADAALGRGGLRHAVPATAATAEVGAALAAAPFARCAWRAVADACLAAALARPGAAGLEALVAERAAAAAPLAVTAAAHLDAMLREADAADAAPDGGEAAHAALLAAAAAAPSPEEGRLLLLLSAFALRTRLRRLQPGDDVAEALLERAGIAFHREVTKQRSRRRRSRKDKKKRRRLDLEEDEDGESDGSDGELHGAPATWRCSLDDFALPRDAAATAELLADAAADAWLRAAQARADEARDERR